MKLILKQNLRTKGIDETIDPMTYYPYDLLACEKKNVMTKQLDNSQK